MDETPPEIMPALSALDTAGAPQAAPVARKTVRAIAAALLLVSLASAPFAKTYLTLPPSFMAAFVGSSAILDFLTAMLLFDLHCIEGSPLFIGAACAYFADALLIIPYGIMFPGVVPGVQRFSNEQTSVWLWLIWHAIFPLAIASGASEQMRPCEPAQRRRRAVGLMLSTLTLALGCTVVDIVGRNFLPVTVQHGVFQLIYKGVAFCIGVLNLGVGIWLIRWKNDVSEIRLWISVALLASSLDVLLNSLSFGRFTIPWYVGKLEMFISASVVLLSLMKAWSALYLAAVQLSVNLRVTLNERMRLQERFDREHMIAAELQQASLPRSLPHFACTSLCAVYRPAVHDLEIGGDWYDAFTLSDNRLVLTVGDVTGKGLAASLVMGKVRQMLRVAALVDADPANILNLVDRVLTNEHPDTLVTAFVAVLERETGILAWASAGHPPSFVRTADGCITALESISLPLGLRDADPPTERIQLGSGAMIVAYTDGLVEAERAIIDGIARVAAALSDPNVYAAENPATALYETVISGNARDDVAVVTLVYTGIPGGLRPLAPERLAWQCWSEDVTSVSQARTELRERLAERGISGAELFTIELAYGELISNVVRYAPGPCESILELSETEIALTVLDQGAGFEFTAVELVDPLAEHGRGLYLVASLGQSFAIARSPQNGTSACVTFARPAQPPSLRLPLVKPDEDDA